MIIQSISKHSSLCDSITASPTSLPRFEESRSLSLRLKPEPRPVAAAQNAGRQHG